MSSPFKLEWLSRNGEFSIDYHYTLRFSFRIKPKVAHFSRI
uniref:Uncharacterized protein n=1 Tax=Rhizophora mucronata TaxID=61149 RepID=A0A2P2JFL9_RHIMU